MKAGKLTGIALAAAAAGMFAMTAAGPAAAQAAKVKCEGVNACKGKSFTEMSQAECDKAKMEMKK